MKKVYVVMGGWQYEGLCDLDLKLKTIFGACQSHACHMILYTVMLSLLTTRIHTPNVYIRFPWLRALEYQHMARV